MKKTYLFIFAMATLLLLPFATATTNYGDIPTDWGGYNVYGDVRYSTVYPASPYQITAFDSVVEHTTGWGSIQIANYTAGSENTAREVNTGGIPIAAGDNVTFSCWMKGADTSSTARIGVDFYQGSTRITAKHSTGNTFYPTEDEGYIINNRVNSTSWILKTIAFTVPATFTADSYSGFTVGTTHAANFMVGWLQGEPTYGGTVYFADATITVEHEATTVTVEPADWNPLIFIFGLAGLLFVLYTGVIKKR